MRTEFCYCGNRLSVMDKDKCLSCQEAPAIVNAAVADQVRQFCVCGRRLAYNGRCLPCNREYSRTYRERQREMASAPRRKRASDNRPCAKCGIAARHPGQAYCDGCKREMQRGYEQRRGRA